MEVNLRMLRKKDCRENHWKGKSDRESHLGKRREIFHVKKSRRKNGKNYNQCLKEDGKLSGKAASCFTLGDAGRK